MRLYLIRHGLANNREKDPERRLSNQGKKEVREISSSAASENKIFAEFIYHSGKPRAMETAEIVADVIEFQGEIEKATDLRPLDDPEIWAEKLKTIDQNIMLVGHMPFMSKMAALLITGSENKEVLDFTTGSIACLNRDDTGLWTLEWASF